jgi:hypothetical protein
VGCLAHARGTDQLQGGRLSWPGAHLEHGSLGCLPPIAAWPTGPTQDFSAGSEKKVSGTDVRAREFCGAGFSTAAGDVGQSSSAVAYQRSTVDSQHNGRVSWRGGELGMESHPVAASKAVVPSLESGIA